MIDSTQKTFPELLAEAFKERDQVGRQLSMFAAELVNLTNQVLVELKRRHPPRLGLVRVVS